MNYLYYFIKKIIRKIFYNLIKYKKILILFLILFLISFSFSRSKAYAMSPNVQIVERVEQVDTINNLKDIQTMVSSGDYLQIELAKVKTSQLKFIHIMTKYYQLNKKFPDIFDTFMRQFFINNYLFMFSTNQTDYTTVANSRTSLYVFYTNSSNTTGDIHDEQFAFSSGEAEIKYSLPSQDYEGTLYSYTYNYPDDVQESFVGGHTVTIPAGVQGIYCNELIEFFYSVDSGEFYNKNTDSYLNDISNSIDETNDFLQNENVKNDSISIIEDTNQDITQSGFDSVFNIIMNAFTSDTVKNIELPLPYVEKTITIESNFLYKALGQNSWILYFVQLFYYYLVGLFVVKDISRIIEKVKTGDIMTSSEENIKAEMM